MALSKSEIESLLSKLRSQFSEYAVKYSPAWFNITSFEERYNHAVTNKLNLESFLISEISNFEVIKTRYEAKKNKPDSFSEKADKIIQDNLNKIAKYPKIDFHPRSSIEAKHMYGALSDLYHQYFSAVRQSISDIILRKQLIQIEEEFNKFVSPRTSNLPEIIEDFVLALNRTSLSGLDIDKLNSGFLKESSFVIFNLINFCEKAIESASSDIEKPISLNAFSPDQTAKTQIFTRFSGCSVKKALEIIKQYSEGIITDFRLSFFKKPVY